MPWTIAICALALLAGACSTAVARNDDGTILARGPLSVFAMRVGDCFDDPDELVSGETLELDEVLAVPCAEPHDNEVFALFDLPDGESAPYPGDDFAYSLAFAECLERFHGYVGVAYRDSVLEVDPFTPTARSWQDRDDREIVCFLYNPDFRPLIGSKRGAFQ